MQETTLALVIMILGITGLYAQEIRPLDASPLDFAVFRPGGQDAKPVARIIYSRPQKKERTIFGSIGSLRQDLEEQELINQQNLICIRTFPFRADS